MQRLSVALLSVVAICNCAAQNTTPDRDPGMSATNLPSQPLGPNDLISLTVYDSPELSRTVRVSPQGDIRLPMVKAPLRAEGLLPVALEKEIADELKKEQLLVDPIVTVTVSEYRSHPISVSGAVRSPLTFQAAEPVTLFDALTRAGGLAPEAGLEILVTKPAPPGPDQGKPVLRRILVRELTKEANPDVNILLTGGEEIRVPEIGKIFVVGNVKKPGAYPVHTDSDTTVLQMLALAEGLDGVTGREAFVYRKEGSGSKNEIPVPLKSIMERKSPDVVLYANDIFYVPEDTGKKARLQALEKAMLFVSTAGASALVYGTVR